MRIIFMGTPDFSVGTLEALVEAGHDVCLAVTQPDKPKGRGKEMQFTPVKEAAVKHGILVYQPKRVRDPECVEELRKYNADVMVVVAFGQILPKEILEMTPYGCINVHASLLPKYRGAAPIQWAIIEGESVTGVTTMQMDEGLDTGDILLVKKVKLDKKETGGSLFDRLSIVGAKLLIKTLEGLETGSIIPEKQNEAESSYVKMLKKSMGELDFTKSARQIECLIRGLNPWPSAFTHLNGKMLKIWDADVVNDSDDIINNNNVSKECEAGTVCYVDKKTFIIKCGKDYLKVNELQLEGKKRMSTDAFLLGSHVEEGTALG